MPTITTFLTYNDQAEDAVKLYTSVFPRSRIVQTTRYGDAGPGTKGSVMTIAFELDGQRFVALNGGPSFTFSPGISLAVSCDTQEELDRVWDGLVAGGKPIQCGWLTDRFGVSWQVVPSRMGELIGDPDPVKGRRTMEAMLKMVKLDIAALQRAHDGAR
jgi:predicted 3-demethylubiquinone-9 3-methyltransferase (glyoxalase superfamily)